MMDIYCFQALEACQTSVKACIAALTMSIGAFAFTLKNSYDIRRRLNEAQRKN